MTSEVKFDLSFEIGNLDYPGIHVHVASNSQTVDLRGHGSLQTALEVANCLKIEISYLNYLYNHTSLACICLYGLNHRTLIFIHWSAVALPALLTKNLSMKIGEVDLGKPKLTSPIFRLKFLIIFRCWEGETSHLHITLLLNVSPGITAVSSLSIHLWRGYYHLSYGNVASITNMFCFCCLNLGRNVCTGCVSRSSTMCYVFLRRRHRVKESLTRKNI